MDLLVASGFCARSNGFWKVGRREDSYWRRLLLRIVAENGDCRLKVSGCVGGAGSVDYGLICLVLMVSCSDGG